MANNFYIDNNNIKIILYIKLFLKSLRLIFLVFNFSFFIGMGWILMCKCYEDWFNAEYDVQVTIPQHWLMGSSSGLTMETTNLLCPSMQNEYPS